MGVDIASRPYGILFHQEVKKESTTLVETVFLRFQLLEITLGELSKCFARLSNWASNGIIV